MGFLRYMLLAASTISGRVGPHLYLLLYLLRFSKTSAPCVANQTRKIYQQIDGSVLLMFANRRC
jgi:hypothetical protein